MVPLSESGIELKTNLMDQQAALSTARRRRRLSIAFRVVVVLAVAGGVGYGLVQQWTDVRDTWHKLVWQSAVLSVLAALGGVCANTMAWRSALRDLDHKVPVGAAARICMVGQLGKYIPGSVWAYVLQTEFARRAGVPRARAFLATVAGIGLSITTSLILGLASLPALLHAASSQSETYAESVRVAIIVGAVLLPIALFCAIPRVLTGLIQIFLRILKKPALSGRMTWAGVLRIMGWSTLAYTCFGLHLWLLANAQAAPGWSGLLRCIGAFAVAMTVGIFAFILPSGFGAREAVLVAALAPFLIAPDNDGIGPAIAIAIASRLLFTIADLVAAGAAAISGLALLRRTSAEQPLSTDPGQSE